MKSSKNFGLSRALCNHDFALPWADVVARAHDVRKSSWQSKGSFSPCGLAKYRLGVTNDSRKCLLIALNLKNRKSEIGADAWDSFIAKTVVVSKLSVRSENHAESYHGSTSAQLS
jgi:hypothetical protein